MARKLDFWKASPAAGGPAAVRRCQPMPATAAQYLARLRPQPFKVPPPRHQQQISVQMEEQPLTPCVVKFIQRG